MIACLLEWRSELEEKEQRINNLNPLTWAYIGDAVYELYVRERLIETTNLKPHKLHIEAVKKVKAEAQANILQKIEEKLNEEEKEIVRRTRNTKNHHLPKNSNIKEYMYATAFEGLIGYLYLTGKEERLTQILNYCV
ncbi:MAG: Mini-ribonuclease 3 [Clostridia bacterium]|nr:Mini-ribonuclease 3 [Clostridia bacterium]